MGKYITSLFATLFVSVFIYSHTHALNASGPIRITELMALNNGSVQDGAGNSPDWFELYNTSNITVNIGGMYLTDKPDNLTKFQIAAGTTLAPHEYKVFWADEQGSLGDTHVNFKLSTDGEYLAIVSQDGEIIQDEINFPEQYSDVSYGVLNDTWEYLAEPTPGAANNSSIYEEEYIDPTPYEELDLYINELMAKNNTWPLEEYFPWNYYYDATQKDWFEIYNATDAPVDLSGMYLTDDKGWHTQYKIADGFVIPAEGFAIFVADGATDLGEHHVNFKLNVAGEYLGLYAPDGKTVIDEVEFGLQQEGISYGRVSNGNVWTFFKTPTIGSANPEAGISLTPQVVGQIGKEERIQDEPYFVALHADSTIAENPVTIYYTLDASEPTEDSPIYTKPINITEHTVIRAIAKENGGYETSNMITESYFMGTDVTTIPIMSFVGETHPKELQKPSNSTISLPPVESHVEFILEDGEKIFGSKTDMKRHGANGQGKALESFRIYAKEKYGMDVFSYPFFEEKDINEFKRLLFRGGEATAAGGTYMRDVFLAQLARGTHAHYQAWQPVSVFVNGKYWAMYNLRERIDEYYVASNFGVDKDNLLFSGGMNILSAKTIDELQMQLSNTEFHPYDPFKDFMYDLVFTDQTDEELVAFLEEEIDIDNFIDYSIIQIFTNNDDWPWNNISVWKEDTPEGKWHWVLKDGDLTLDQLHVFDLSMYEEKTFEYRINLPGELLDDSKYVTYWGIIMGEMVQNETLRNKFLTRFADMLNSSLSADGATSVWKEIEDTMRPEIGKHAAAGWSKNDYTNITPEKEAYWLDIWEDTMAWAHGWLEERPEIIQSDIVTYFPDITAAHKLSLNFGCGGTVEVNGIPLDHGPWSGTYFEGVPVTLTATANDGFYFAGWSGADLPGDATVELNLTEDTALTPLFKRYDGFFENKGFDAGLSAWKIDGSATAGKIDDESALSLGVGTVSQSMPFTCEADGIDGGWFTANLSADVRKKVLHDDTPVMITLAYLDANESVIEEASMELLADDLNSWNSGYLFTNDAGEPRAKKVPVGTRSVRAEITIADDLELNAGAYIDDVHLHLYNRLDRTSRPTRNESDRFSYDRRRYDAFLKKQHELMSPTRRYRFP